MARPLFLKIFYPLLLITLLAILAVSSLSLYGSRQVFLDKTQQDLQSFATLASPFISELLEQNGPEKINESCAALGAERHIRVTIIAADGEVIGDSHESIKMMDNHSYRPEVIASAKEAFGVSTRFSNTLDEDMMYVCRRLGDTADSEYIRIAQALDFIDLSIKSITVRILGSAALFSALAILLSIFISRRISLPLAGITHKAKLFAEGDFSERISEQGARELDQLAEAMNHMATQLDGTIKTIQRQQNQKQAVFSGMVEGVVSLDRDHRISDMNSAARRMLNINLADVKGRPIAEVSRHPDLLHFVNSLEESEQPMEGQLRLLTDDEIHLNLYGSRLLNEADETMGFLIVIYDVTQLRKLEGIRREFVANVSHELKTPTTSIIGFVETLRDGAIDNPDDAERFLSIIERQSKRLNTIIEDILSLSRVEQQYEQDLIEKSPMPILELLETVQTDCKARADARNITLNLECPEELTVAINRELIEQALLNLVNNSIKYGDPDSEIKMTATVKDSHELILSVCDQSEGIAPAHLERLFERFYRVDKDRSRKVGGTGLGLAIVKHVAQAHGGTARVQSTEGVGSCFTIHIPLATPHYNR